MLRISFLKALIVPFFLFTMNLYASPTALTLMTSIASNPLPDAFSCNLPAPTGVFTAFTSTTSIGIAWNAVGGASQYHVKAVTDLGVTVFDANVPSPTVVVNAPPSTTVNFVISAVCSDGEKSPNSAPHADTTDSVIIADVVANFPGIPTIIPFGCEYAFTLPDNLNNRFYFKAYTGGLTPSEAVFGLHKRVNGSFYIPVVTFGSSFGSSSWAFKTNKDEEPLPFQETSGAYVKIFHNSNYVLQLIISPTEDGLSNFHTVCAIPQPGVSGYQIDRLVANTKQVKEKSLDNLDILPTTPQLHPNPFTDGITLSLPETSTEAATLRIFDLNGKEVMTENIEIGTSSKSMQTTDLTPGMYFARLESANSVKTFKMCKSR